jgi:hypothetical protein
MIRGQLSKEQRDAAWRDIDPVERLDASALPQGNDPNEPTTEQLAFRARIQREQELDENFGRGEISQDVGRRATGAGATRQNEVRLSEERKKERQKQTDTQMLLASLDQARDFADQRGRDADRFEDGFEDRFGDAWREEIANRVMEPDDVPQRMDGENIEDYRARLEDELIETMIDPETGEIRPEYADSPEMREYAEWALAKYDQRIARAYIDRRSDPTLTAEQVREIDEEHAATATGQRMVVTLQENSGNEDIEPVVERLDENREEVSTPASGDGFLGAAP